MKLTVGLGLALVALHLSCSDMQELGGSEATTDNRQTSLDASQHISVDPNWVFQTFEDNEFEMDLLATQWKTVANIQFVEKPELGKLIFDSDRGTWIYQPKENVFGEDRFTVEMINANGKSTIQPVVANILPVNDAPETRDLTLKLPRNSSLEFTLLARDIEEQGLLANIDSQPENGSIEIIEGDQLKVKYTPNAGFSGLDQVSVMVSDGDLDSAAKLNFEVLADDGLLAADGSYEVNAGESVDGKLEWMDPDADDLPISIEIVQNVQNGLLIIDPNQENFTYTANSDFEGDDTFMFRVRRGNMLSNTATVTITVKKVNQPPSMPPPHEQIVITCPRHEPCYGQIPSHDPEHDKVYYKIGDHPSYGTISDWDEYTGHFTYHPNPHDPYYDQDHFTFWLEDCYGHKSKHYSVVIEFEDDWLLFEDSFERDYVTNHDPSFHWRFLIDDNGKGIEESNQECKDHICAKIFQEGQYDLGPMGHEHRSLFFFGREGQSTHDIFLISKGFDLSHYNYVDISFMYLLMDIGDNDSKEHKYTEEYLRAEVCLYGEYECGLEPLDPHKLRSDKWIKVFQNDPYDENNHLNGRNHSQHDWQHASFRVDLNDLEHRYPSCHRNNFVFRFNSRLQDGFKGNKFHNYLEDAIAIDKVVLKAGKGH